MRRMLAEVLESSPSTPTPGEELPWHDLTCRVKLLSSVPESHHLPDDIKGTTCTVRRRALFDWEYKPGSKIILNPEECRKVVARPAEVPDLGSLRGKVVTYRTDINGDGFTERIAENSFIRVVIGPRFGARIWEITHKRSGWNPLSATYDFSKDWVEIGGQEDHISEQPGQGEFWNANFAEKEAVTDEKGFRGVYEFKSEKSKGITLTKEIVVPVDAPVVYFRCTFKYTGAEKPPEDGKPVALCASPEPRERGIDEFEMTAWPRVSVAVPDESKASYVFIVPTKTKLHRLRRNRGWRSPRGFGLSAPYHLAQDEDTGRCLALLLDPAQTHFGMVCEGRSHFETIEPKMKQVKLAKDGEQSYGFALVVGDAADADQQGLAITATGPTENGETPHFAFAIGDTKKPRARRAPVAVDMTETDYPGLPKLFQGTAWIGNSHHENTK